MADEILRLRHYSPRTALVLNPGQGHVSLLLSKILNPNAIWLVDRDLLALRFAEANLIDSGFPADRISTHHQVGLNSIPIDEVDLIVAMLRPKEPQDRATDTVRHILSSMPAGGKFILGASSTMITRCLTGAKVDKHGLRVQHKRNKGFSAVVLEGFRKARP